MTSATLRSIRSTPRADRGNTLALGIGAGSCLQRRQRRAPAVLPCRRRPRRDRLGRSRNRNVRWPFSIGLRGLPSSPSFEDWRDRHGRNARRSNGGQKSFAANATTNIFSVIGLRLERGRSFTDEEGLPPAPPPVRVERSRARLPALCRRESDLSHSSGSVISAAKNARQRCSDRQSSLEVIGILAPGAELLFRRAAAREQQRTAASRGLHAEPTATTSAFAVGRLKSASATGPGRRRCYDGPVNLCHQGDGTVFPRRADCRVSSPARAFWR